MTGAGLALQPSARRRPQTASALGARIRALPADQLADFQVYRTPKPLERKMAPGGGPPGTYTSVTVDPEDDPQTLEPVKPRRALAR